MKNLDVICEEIYNDNNALRYIKEILNDYIDKKFGGDIEAQEAFINGYQEAIIDLKDEMKSAGREDYSTIDIVEKLFKYYL